MSTKSFNIFVKKKLPENIRGINPDEDFNILLNQCKENNINIDIKRLRKAFDINYDVYKDTIYINNIPRYAYSLAVAMIVAKEIPLDEDSIISAILHDIWQDNDKYDYEIIKREFGEVVANIVDGLHKIKNIDINLLHEPEKIESYRKFLVALSSDFRIILVKLAETLANMRNVQFYAEEEQQRIAREAFEIYTPFANRLGLRNLKWELDDLAFQVLNPIEYKTISDYLAESKESREEYIKKFTEPLIEKLDKDDFLKKLKITYEITGRAKHIFSIYNKIHLRQKPIDELYDLFAIRVILNTEDANMCYYVYGILASIYPPVPETFKDYISVPKKNGYRSLHTAVFGINGKVVEIQIRTKNMHDYSENGVAAHFKYKTHLNKSSILEQQEIQEWMSVVREIFENPDMANVQNILDKVRTNLFSDEIYVYTPMNEFVTMPINSTPLDFAFKIHSEVGNHFVGAKVNGKMVPIDYKLRNGDKVEIIVSNNAKPTEDWYNFVITSRAISELDRFFKEESRNKENRGKDKWQREQAKRKIFINDKKLLDFLAEFNIQSITDFYLAIAEDDIDLKSFTDFLVDKLFKNERDKKIRNEDIQKGLEFLTNHNNQIVEEQPVDIVFERYVDGILKFKIRFIATENYKLINQISQLILQFNDIIITKFDFDLEKSKVNSEIEFETINEESAIKLYEDIRNLNVFIKYEDLIKL